MKRKLDGDPGSNPGDANSRYNYLELLQPEPAIRRSLHRSPETDYAGIKKRLYGYGYGDDNRRLVGEIFSCWVLERCSISSNMACEHFIDEHSMDWGLIQQLGRTIHGSLQGCWFSNRVLTLHPFGFIKSKIDFDVWEWFASSHDYEPCEWISTQPESIVKIEPEDHTWLTHIELDHLFLGGLYDAVKKVSGISGLLK